MFNKFVLATALVGSVLATGASASAAEFSSTPPTSPPERVTPIGDFSGKEAPGYSAYTLVCSGRVVCESLQRFCAKEGGNYYDVSDRNGGVGVCINN
ncbi:hypothetical protein [Ilumatobacter coccineus]|uniref:Uncharacterized protein n=1 Tax=Ilumatobacter coccineus (strain NBRC 103263 / KCTC 29153 / YM16-304) TaxID=1313172 RepID=A0A6C7E4Z6_ILUCY|nr:hypothetical protein [Ilumatobacter coccineus]BAN01650.1 hypothetical protein YM304_13360 [Ilumatobacter coccineus YM16-304]